MTWGILWVRWPISISTLVMLGVSISRERGEFWSSLGTVMVVRKKGADWVIDSKRSRIGTI